MFDPPAGHKDLEADAARAPERTDPYRELTVPGLGVFYAREPLPASAAALAMAANPDIDAEHRSGYLKAFIEQHLQSGEFENLLVRMILDDTVPGDATLRLVRAIATQGTARPYTAVINLAATAALNWRSVRTRLRDRGIADPMALPSMHDVLDEAEAIAIESFANGGKTALEVKAKVSSYYDQIYAPDLDGQDGDELPIPAGFSPTEMAASFASAARALAR